MILLKGTNTASKQVSSTNLSQASAQTTSTSQQLSSKLNLLIDESNHVSYSFEFFLHGSSRVCTSVDIAMHKPIRVVNQLDLIKMRSCLKKHFQYASSKRRRDRGGVGNIGLKRPRSESKPDLSNSRRNSFNLPPKGPNSTTNQKPKDSKTSSKLKQLKL